VSNGKSHAMRRKERAMQAAWETRRRRYGKSGRCSVETPLYLRKCVVGTPAAQPEGKPE